MNDDAEFDPGSGDEGFTSPPNLGPCCICERAQDGTVRNLVMLDFEAPPGAVGWGCVQCHAPSRGAQALICDHCIEVNGHATLDRLKFIAGGMYMADRVRVRLEGFERKPFGHNTALHPELIES